MSRKIWSCLLAVVVFGCTQNTQKDSPQKTLSEYVARSFAIKSLEDKAKLLELTTGEVKTTLEKLDENSFRHYFIDGKKQFIALKVRDERKLDAERYSITYELTYVNDSSESKDKVTNKKHALFVSQNGKWVISEVRNLKTFIEHQNEMSF